jgi:hypothetical protein
MAAILKTLEIFVQLKVAQRARSLETIQRSGMTPECVLGPTFRLICYFIARTWNCS